MYVDNMLITSKNKSAIDKLKKDLSSKFEMKDLSEAKKVLRMDIKRDCKGGKVSLTQNGYLKKVIQKSTSTAMQSLQVHYWPLTSS